MLALARAVEPDAAANVLSDDVNPPELTESEIVASTEPNAAAGAS